MGGASEKGSFTSRYTAKRDASIGTVCETDHWEWSVSNAFRAAAKKNAGIGCGSKKIPRDAKNLTMSPMRRDSYDGVNVWTLSS